MTATEASGHAHGARSEEDRISTPRIVWVGVVSLAVFVVSAMIVTVYWRERMAAAPAPPAPAEAGRSKIGLVEQQPFDVAERGARDREVRLERLGSFGWVDRRTGVVHIPIDRAMDLVQQGVRARPGGGQEQRNIGGQP